MMGKWRGWRYDKASPEEKLLTLAGVPPRFWKPARDPDFRPISFETRTGNKKTISSKSQSEFAEALREEEELVRGHLVVIGSVNEDTQSLALAFDWVRRFIVERGRVQVKVVDLADVPGKKDVALDGTKTGARWWTEAYESQVLLMHNILGKDCTPDRVQVCRDLVRAFPNTTRILVVAGESPVVFAQEVLCVRPDVCFYTDGQLRRTVSH